MTKIIEIGWGACAPMRPEHVLTNLEPYGVRVLNLKIDVQPTHSAAHVTVNDAQAREAEYWLCRCGLFSLLSKPIDARNIVWAKKWQDLPIQRGCDAHHESGVKGRMPVPGAKRPRKLPPAKKPGKAKQPKPKASKRSRIIDFFNQF